MSLAGMWRCLERQLSISRCGRVNSWLRKGGLLFQKSMLWDLCTKPGLYHAAEFLPAARQAGPQT